MKRNIIWHKVKNETYQPECNDELMATLCLFFEDGLPFQSYIDFLENKYKNNFIGNISEMEKKEEKVTISINEHIFPNKPIFVTTIENMVDILQEYQRLYYLGAEKIEIYLDDDKLMIKGE